MADTSIVKNMNCLDDFTKVDLSGYTAKEIADMMMAVMVKEKKKQIVEILDKAIAETHKCPRNIEILPNFIGLTILSAIFTHRWEWWIGIWFIYLLCWISNKEKVENNPIKMKQRNASTMVKNEILSGVHDKRIEDTIRRQGNYLWVCDLAGIPYIHGQL